MAEATLKRLARAAGLAVKWTDASGKAKTVGPDTLRTVLERLDLPANSDRQMKDSLLRAKDSRSRDVPLLVGQVGTRIAAPVKARAVPLLAEDGREHVISIEDGRLTLPREPGYYQLDDGRRIAVTPRHAWLPERPAWGIGVQVYALRGGSTEGFGDFAALASFCTDAAAQGAGAVAISPVHALFGAAPHHISPYAPSTRLWLNPLYAALPRKATERDASLVDWPAAVKRKWRALRTAFDRFEKDSSFHDFVRRGGERLLAHARFEVLDARFRAQGCKSWRDWPAAYQDAGGPATRQLSARDPEIAFQLFVQWRADTSLAAAQTQARASGMRVGLIADMAVGMDPAGSHAWSAPKEVLNGLTVGAPPDIFNSRGQNWGLTNLSPKGLTEQGYSGFIATLRSAMRNAGGIRLDHAMGLQRLWVIPEGADPAEGVYLHYPRDKLLGLTALESQRHRTILIAEDLGTVPAGFRERLARAHMLGMRVLWFERDSKGNFLPPHAWDPNAAALSTTHDLATLAGWWSGSDIRWRRKLGLEPDVKKAKQDRARDRDRLWRTLKKSGCATGAAPASRDRFVDAAFKEIAATPCPLKLLPIEDFLGEKEQPNIPGTIDEHPNWRRRLKTAKPFANAAARRRAAVLNTP
jgi:4-alpha-glucanotransferase